MRNVEAFMDPSPGCVAIAAITTYYLLDLLAAPAIAVAGIVFERLGTRRRCNERGRGRRPAQPIRSIIQETVRGRATPHVTGLAKLGPRAASRCCSCGSRASR